MRKTMDHAEYQEKLKGKTIAELLFIAKDAKEAMVAMPDNPNNSYYADEVCYALMELNKRR